MHSPNFHEPFKGFVMTPETHIEVPSSFPSLNPQLSQPPTLYDYLALLPVLITALTPLILGLQKKKSSTSDK